MLRRAAGKIVELPALLERLQIHREHRDKIVFTNGCFDLLHPGHVHTFEHARIFGDVLVVGLNSDISVIHIKGPFRPIQDQDSRAFVLASLESVDYVTIFSDDTPEDLIGHVHPDVLIKGADWKGRLVAGQHFVESYGGRVEFAPTFNGHSTSRLVDRVKGC